MHRPRTAVLAGAILTATSLLVRVHSAPPAPVFILEGLNAEVGTPEGCSWHEEAARRMVGTRFFVCGGADGQPLVSLMVEDRDLRLSPPEQFFGPFKKGLGSAAEKTGGTLVAFSYDRLDLGTPDSYRYQAQTAVAGGNVYAFGYVQLYDRAYTVHGGSRTQDEPAMLLATARSVRLLAPAQPVSNTAERAGTAFEILVLVAASIAAAYVWSRRKRRTQSQTAREDPPERGPGVHI